MTNSGRPSFVGTRECKLNRRPKLRRRPHSPRFEMLSFFRANGRFPEVAEIHPSIVALVAQQLGVDTGPIADQSVNVSLLGNTVRVPHPSRLLAAWEPRTFDRNQPYLA